MVFLLVQPAGLNSSSFSGQFLQHLQHLLCSAAHTRTRARAHRISAQLPSEPLLGGGASWDQAAASRRLAKRNDAAVVPPGSQT